MDQEEWSHPSKGAVLVPAGSIQYSAPASLCCIRREVVDLHKENESCKILHNRDYVPNL